MNNARASLYAILGIAAAIVVIIGIAAAWTFGWGWFSQSSANFRGETSKRNQIEANGGYRIAAYDHFFDLCAHVQTDEASIANLLDEQHATTDAQRKSVLAASITALRNNRAESINDYNADAAKSYTLGQFRASNLPYHLDLTTKDTSCSS